MNNPPDFIHLFIGQFWRILKMDYPAETDNPSLVWPFKPSFLHAINLAQCANLLILECKSFFIL